MLTTRSTQTQILPSWKNFLSFKEEHARLPVVAQRKVKGLSPALLFSRLFDDKVGGFLLESGKGPNSTARYSFFGDSNGHWLQLDADHPDSLDVLIQKINFDPQKEEISYVRHFWGGWVGFFAYETARLLEPVALDKKNPHQIPDLFLVETGTLLVYDHEEAILKVILTLHTDSACFETYTATVNCLSNLWLRLDEILDNSTPPKIPQSHATQYSIPPESQTSRAAYCERVEKAKYYIEEGDIYQANLAQKFEVPFDGSPSELYHSLKTVNPSPFGGLFYLPQGALVSSSPERLVKIENGWVETRPIAGTRPRGDSAKEDGRLSQELLLNEKERAEHLMLVDLERNDLGRLCEYGTVEVTDLMSREQYSHVHHIVSNIRGKLKQGIGLREILTAVFPGGTITGCPKIRCMEIIEELEPVRRGPYCGSLGYIGYGPYLDLNILIRTFLLKDGLAIFHAGAGIVADSVADAEYEETLSKALALFQALNLKTS